MLISILPVIRTGESAKEQRDGSLYIVVYVHFHFRYPSFIKYYFILYKTIIENLGESLDEDVISYGKLKEHIEKAELFSLKQETDNLFWKDFCDYYKIHMEDKTAPYEGINGMLTNIKKAGFKTVGIYDKNNPYTVEQISSFSDILIDENGTLADLIEK